MKRTDVTAILLGILALVFFFPFAFLIAGVLVRGVVTNGIHAGAGGFAWGLSLRRILFLIVFIVFLPILISWIGRQFSKTRR
jgi:hypothetical protein